MKKKITSSFYMLSCIFFLLPLSFAFIYVFFQERSTPAEDGFFAAVCIIMVAIPVLSLILFPSFLIFDQKALMLIYLFRKKVLKWDEIDYISIDVTQRSTDYILHTKNKSYRILKSRRTMKYLYEYWGDFGDDTGFLEFLKEILNNFKKTLNKLKGMKKESVKDSFDALLKDAERDMRKKVRAELDKYQPTLDSLKIKAWTKYEYTVNGDFFPKRPQKSYQYHLEITVTDHLSNIHSQEQICFDIPLLVCRIKTASHRRKKRLSVTGSSSHGLSNSKQGDLMLIKHSGVVIKEYACWRDELEDKIHSITDGVLKMGFEKYLNTDMENRK